MVKMLLVLATAVCSLNLICGSAIPATRFHHKETNPNRCPVPESIRREISIHKTKSEAIIDYFTEGKGKGDTYNRLAEFVDRFGSRIAGSQNLENAIDYMLKNLSSYKLDNVHGEDVTVPHWVRGQESLMMVKPREYHMNILGLGGSIGTPPDGITAEVIVVRSFDELKNRSNEVPGKIVVFNEDWKGYGTSVAYRDYGAKEAAKLGGVASLIRSVTPFSIDSPHTGWQDYVDGIKKIPTACITIEDAQMMHRMSKRGTKIVVTLKMEAKNMGTKVSRNTIAEIKGYKYPEQVVLVSGHLDSWDVGQGAMDDGGGAFISMQVLRVLREMNIRPKRTLRLVLWTGEEEGLWGAQEYFKRHASELKSHSLLMESDIGTFTPYGLTVDAKNNTGLCILQEIVNLLKGINASKIVPNSDVGSDISIGQKSGVPGASLANYNSNYFYYHHSNGDMMTVENTKELDLCAAVWTVSAYMVADLEDMLPRHNPT
ncbi:Carboxypeptidase Q [Nymphon striatum]|nr:Carboxypeptidase Q [Nymphon striatum]